MKDTIFRQYDIRGKVGTELIVEQTDDLACAIAQYLKLQKNTIKTIAVGMDGRVHSEAIKNKVITGLVNSGLDVVFIGLCSSPVLYFACNTMPVDAGLMITASHNPKEYNGIKIMLGTDSVSGTAIQEIKKLFRAKKWSTNNTVGMVKNKDVIPLYITWLVDHFKNLVGKKLHAVIDCGNGAGGAIVPALIKRMKWQNVVVLHADVDGTYPNHDANPTKLENMQDVLQYLKSTPNAIGVGLDGDADRVAAITKSGKLILGDQLLALFAQNAVAKGATGSVVYDVNCSSLLSDVLKDVGLSPVLSPTGTASIKLLMKKHNAIMGGELSCHFFFKDRHFGYDDGIYAMLRLFELVHETGQTLDKLVEKLSHKQSSPSIRISCREEDKATIVEGVKKRLQQRDDVTLTTIDGVRVTFDYGWGLVRASNTENKIGVRFEGNTKNDLLKLQEEFTKLLSPYFDKKTLDDNLQVT